MPYWHVVKAATLSEKIKLIQIPSFLLSWDALMMLASRQVHQLFVGGAGPDPFSFNVPRPPQNVRPFYAALEGGKSIRILL